MAESSFNSAEKAEKSKSGENACNSIAVESLLILPAGHCPSNSVADESHLILPAEISELNADSSQSNLVAATETMQPHYE